jgi:hypothetical protein
MAHIVSVKKNFYKERYAASRVEEDSKVLSKRSSCVLLEGDQKVSDHEITEVKINQDRLNSS